MEAVKVLKEIIQDCKVSDASWFSLMEPNAKDILSPGYQIHIKAVALSNYSKVCLQNILKKYDLSIANKPKNQVTVIFKNKKPEPPQT